MHYHCEIVMPPPGVEEQIATNRLDEYVTTAVTSILNPFDESRSDEEDASGHPFWDWWVIGGRWSGGKIMERISAERMDVFYAWLREEGVTVSGVKAGKDELTPATQIPKVDTKWNEMFPEVPGPCPLFKHAGDLLPGDISTVKDTPASLECERVIVAGRSFVDNDWTGPFEAKFMLCKRQWNGCNHMPIQWDGTLGSALDDYRKSLDSYTPEYAQKFTPTDDWLVVTVDYHT